MKSLIIKFHGKLLKYKDYRGFFKPKKKLLENIHRIVTKTVLSMFVVNLRQSDWFLKISKTASMHSSRQKSCRLQNKKKIDKIYSTGTNTKNDIV